MNLKQLKALEKSECKRLLKLVEFENRAKNEGYLRIAGVDEVGRGPLAGPVVAAACLFKEEIFFPGINDSKLLTPLKRNGLYQALVAHQAVQFGIGIIEPAIIDQVNIYQASLLAMKQAVENLKERPDYLLVDGVNLQIPGIKSERIIKGDSLSQSIAAASILAKEFRDRLMTEYHRLYPMYHFHENKGYGTAKHYEGLKKHGPCPIHRKSFAPVREIGAAFGLDQELSDVKEQSVETVHEPEFSEEKG